MSLRDDCKQDLDDFTSAVKQAFENLKNIPEDISDSIYDATHKNEETHSKKSRKPIRIIGGTIAVVLLLTIGRLPIFKKPLPTNDASQNSISTSVSISTHDAISAVQEGYFGEFTDVTVQQILDINYGMLYDSNCWDGGTTDNGEMIVEAKYYNNGDESDGMTIQFTMLNNECFEISAFVDPWNPIEKNTDLLAAMNYNYLVAYSFMHRNDIQNNYNDFFEVSFIDRLNMIPASSVLYGASATYTGDRTKLHELANGDVLEVSAIMLLDHYGLFDLSYYINETTAPTEKYSPPENQNQLSTQDVIDALYLVLSNQEPLLLTDSNSYTTVYGVSSIADETFNSVLTPVCFTVVDLDQDGNPEAVVELTNGNDGWMLVLHYENRQMYGYGFNYRAFSEICTDGLIAAFSGADSTDFYTVSFDHNACELIPLSGLDEKMVWNNWVDVEWFDFSPENVDYVFN